MKLERSRYRASKSSFPYLADERERGKESDVSWFNAA